MPLGTREHDDRNSNLCGVFTDFTLNLSDTIDRNLTEGGFDYLVTPLVHPSFRANQEEVAKEQKCGSNSIFNEQMSMQLWLRCRVLNDTSGSISSQVDSWKVWNLFHQLCDHHSQLKIVLDIESTTLGDLSQNLWWGEPVVAAIISSDIFYPRRDRAYNSDNNFVLPDTHQDLVKEFLRRSIHIIISGTPAQPMTTDPNTHPLGRCRNHIAHLCSGSPPEPGLQHKLPIKNYSDFLGHERLEKDTEKFDEYRRAIGNALRDTDAAGKTKSPLKAFRNRLGKVLLIAGAGCRPLVEAAMEAAKETGVRVKVVAVEKNPHVAIALKEFIEDKAWDDTVKVVVGDVRDEGITTLGSADILVTDFLGSFGDNELSPEYIDGAQKYLKEGAITIPSSYSSYLQPLTASELYNDSKKYECNLHFRDENVLLIASEQPVFTFEHKKKSKEEDYKKRLEEKEPYAYTKLSFAMSKYSDSTIIHGFAGYFIATLYKDVQFGNTPSSRTPYVYNRLPLFFPLETPLCVPRASQLEVHFWRLSNHSKVWYEWCVASPFVTPIRKSNGCAFSLEL